MPASSAPGAPQSPEDLSLDEVHAISKVNVDGVLLGCKHAIRAMKDRGGAIVNLSSIAGIYAVPALVPYGASKGAVRQLTKSVAAYCGKQGYGIRCNSVHPGIIETAMGETVLNFIFDDPEQGREERRQGIPLGRLGQAEGHRQRGVLSGLGRSEFREWRRTRRRRRSDHPVARTVNHEGAKAISQAAFTGETRTRSSDGLTGPAVPSTARREP